MDFVLADTMELRGTPFKADDGIATAPPRWLTEICEAHEEGSVTVIAWNNLNGSPTEYQRIVFEIVQSNGIGGHSLPRNTIHMASDGRGVVGHITVQSHTITYAS